MRQAGYPHLGFEAGPVGAIANDEVFQVRKLPEQLRQYIDHLIEPFVALSGSHAPHCQHYLAGMKTIAIDQAPISLSRREAIHINTIRQHESPVPRDFRPLHETVGRIATDRNEGIDTIDQKIRERVTRTTECLVAMNDERQSRLLTSGCQPR